MRYKTTDIFVSTVLVCMGYTDISIERNGKQTTFVFEDPSEEIPAVVEDYFNKKLEIEPNLLFMELKNLKSRLRS